MPWLSKDSPYKEIVVDSLRKLATMIEKGDALIIRSPEIRIEMLSGPAMMEYNLKLVTESVVVGEALQKLFKNQN